MTSSFFISKAVHNSVSSYSTNTSFLHPRLIMVRENIPDFPPPAGSDVLEEFLQKPLPGNISEDLRKRMKTTLTAEMDPNNNTFTIEFTDHTTGERTERTFELQEGNLSKEDLTAVEQEVERQEKEQERLAAEALRRLKNQY